MAIRDEDYRKPRSHAQRTFREPERTVWIGAFMVPVRLATRVLQMLEDVRPARVGEKTDSRPRRQRQIRT